MGKSRGCVVLLPRFDPFMDVQFPSYLFRSLYLFKVGQGDMLDPDRLEDSIQTAIWFTQEKP